MKRYIKSAYSLNFANLKRAIVYMTPTSEGKYRVVYQGAVDRLSDDPRNNWVDYPSLQIALARAQRLAGSHDAEIIENQGGSDTCQEEMTA